MARLSFAPLLNLFLSASCPLCDRPGQPLLCTDCQRQLQDCRPFRSPVSPQLASLQAPQIAPHIGPIIAWGNYENRLKQAIAQLKYHDRPILAQPLGEGLAQAWLQSQPSSPNSRFQSAPKPWVLPVPMHPAKQRQRGFNQAELIARSFCRHTGLPLLAQGVQRVQATQPQFELSPAERQRNVAQAFAVGPALQKHRNRRPVLLLDDIYTTGATLRAIAQILTPMDIPILGAVVVARAMP